MSDDSDVLNCDLLVLGAGMAGMTAAAYAAHHGLVVLVVEKAEDIGGSAIISGGAVWTALDYDTFRLMNPEGNEHQARVISDHYEELIGWIKEMGVRVDPVYNRVGGAWFDTRFNFIDIVNYFGLCKAYVANAGGNIVVKSTPASLIVEDGRVVGAHILTETDERVEVRARATLLATGGFQNSNELRRKYISERAADFLVRSNPDSDGCGLRLGLEAGAALSPKMSSWYGHTLPWPLNREITERDYIPLAQFGLSPRSVLLDRQGRRLLDESRAYYYNAQMVADQPDARALLVFDEQSRSEDADQANIGFDRPQVARQIGAHVAEANSWEEVGRMAAGWGYANVAKTIEDYNRRIADEDPNLDPPRFRHRRPLMKPPFFAIEVQPAITFTHGGLGIDEKARVLDDAGKPIPGLFAAGADAGGTYHRSYAGGLSMAGIFGIECAKELLAG
ncbi:FAD-dependent oxidoreductase [Paracoccus pantotrophus]|uniref:FAD-dependent oxidoreductase n=1 Tax=Paracoccus pantotrophus TaxID=82367 RepID=UPI00048B90CD|nr:FAD-dependent oxidoreductase [Paracoccus pantotrophus]